MVIKAESTVHFQTLLMCEDAFYNDPNYDSVTLEEFSQLQPLSPSYIVQTEEKKLSWVSAHLKNFQQKLQAVVAKMGVLPSSDPKYTMRISRTETIKPYSPEYILKQRIQVLDNKEFKYKRLTVHVDGMNIDAILMGKPETFGNGRFTLYSPGNGWPCTNKLAKMGDFQELLTHTKSNGLVFDYPSTAASTGLPSKETMIKAYKAMMMLLENEILAKEIIAFGHSIGGGVQGQYFNTHEFKKNVHIVLVKSKTFKDFISAANESNRMMMENLQSKPFYIKILPYMLYQITPLVLKLTDWNFDSVPSTREANVEQLILQTAKVKRPEVLTDSSKIVFDGIITHDSSLANAVLNDPVCREKKNITVVGVPDDHFTDLSETKLIANIINEKLAKSKAKYAAEKNKIVSFDSVGSLEPTAINA